MPLFPANDCVFVFVFIPPSLHHCILVVYCILILGEYYFCMYINIYIYTYIYFVDVIWWVNSDFKNAWGFLVPLPTQTHTHTLPTPSPPLWLCFQHNLVDFVSIRRSDFLWIIPLTHPPTHTNTHIFLSVLSTLPGILFKFFFKDFVHTSNAVAILMNILPSSFSLSTYVNMCYLSASVSEVWGRVDV